MIFFFFHIIHYYLFYDLSLSESRGICLLFDIQIHAVFHYIEISLSSENILQNNFSYLRHDTSCIPIHHPGLSYPMIHAEQIYPVFLATAYIRFLQADPDLTFSPTNYNLFMSPHI